MYKIDLQGNKLEKLQERSFADHGFKEKKNLQEWIDKEPTVFGEELLIIQKEFSGFSNTPERLDLLALDKQGSLVIIENKLDDSGRDVTWQALKYASYCSSLSKENIRKVFQDYLDTKNFEEKAKEKLAEFLEEKDYEKLDLNKGVTQRIILVAAKFRREVTSTVLWLLNFKIQLQCFRMIPHSIGEEHFLKVEQIIPIQDAEEYMINMAEKAQDDITSQAERQRKKITESATKKEFWGKLIDQMNKKSTLYKNISPSIFSWIGTSSGFPGVGLNFSADRSCARAELYIDRGKANRGKANRGKRATEESKFIFDQLYKQKERIDEKFKDLLTWERLDEGRACRIKTEIPGDVLEKEQWDKMQAFMVKNMLLLEKVMKKPLMEIKKKLKAREHGTEEGSG